MDRTGERGVQFPLVDGRRSSTALSRDVVARATADVAPSLADAVERESAWHRAYPGYFRELTAVAARSPAAASSIARTGLDRLHESFEFVDDDGAVVGLDDAVAADPAAPLGRRAVTGTGEHPKELEVPYRGRLLRGAALVEQAEEWAARGVVEPSFVTALGAVVANPDWLDLHDRSFALLGAGAEMGPTELLLSWGADVHAVDLPVPHVWDRLEGFAAAGTGTLHVPVRADGSDGADLLVDTAAIRRWLGEADGPLLLGNYVYLDGADFVRVAVAADAVIVGVLRERDDVALAYLATPTDVFAVPAEAVEGGRRRYADAGALGVLGRAVRPLTGGRAFVPNHRETLTTEDGRELGIADCLIVQQGPNYALAKRLQRWRALVASQDGLTSSVHVAPTTRTHSVTKNRVLAAAYRGAHVVDVEPFDPATSRALMAALLVHDLRTAEDGDAGTSEHDLTAAAAHSGLWRTAWEPRSALGVAVLAGLREFLPGDG